MLSGHWRIVSTEQRDDGLAGLVRRMRLAGEDELHAAAP